MKQLFTSKKLWSALIGAVTAFIATLFGMESDAVLVIIAPFLAQITGQSVVDVRKEGAAPAE